MPKSTPCDYFMALQLTFYNPIRRNLFIIQILNFSVLQENGIFTCFYLKTYKDGLILEGGNYSNVTPGNKLDEIEAL